MEVGIGPDAEVFTKAAVLTSVGSCELIGILKASQWNNPEPELAMDSQGRIRGVTLGNDGNLRDIEGRSALLLGITYLVVNDKPINLPFLVPIRAARIILKRH